MFSDFQRKELGFLTKSWHWCKCCIVSVHRNILWTFFPDTKSVSKLSLDFEPRLSNFCDLSDFFGRFVNIAFYVSGWIFWGSKFFITSCFSSCMFSKLGRKNFGAKTYFDLKGRQKSILYARRSFATKINFLRKIDFYRIDFGVWPAIFLTLGDKTWNGCQKPTLRVLINFEEKQLFSQNQIWYIFFGP